MKSKRKACIRSLVQPLSVERKHLAELLDVLPCGSSQMPNIVLRVDAQKLEAVLGCGSVPRPPRHERYRADHRRVAPSREWYRSIEVGRVTGVEVDLGVCWTSFAVCCEHMAG